jgi:glycosyltransferase involved in cell wall biosynthesis
VSPLSVVVTVLNDREELGQLLPALSRQSRPLGELIVVDGGSTDGTLGLLEEWRDTLPIRVIDAPGTNISQGRNVGIAAARTDWVACTDAGCRPVPGWLAAFEAEQGEADLLAGIYVVEGRTAFERALAVALYPSPDEIDTRERLVVLWLRVFGKRYEASHAATRSIAFSVDLWRAVGGFPEHLYAGEDPAFSLAAIERGFTVRLVPDAAVHWRPRATWRANARMYRAYARGSVRAGSPVRHAARGVAWSLAPVLMARGGRTSRLGVGAGALAYLWLPLRRARRTGMPVRQWWRIPLVMALKDLSQVAGAVLGLLDAGAGRSQPAPLASGRSAARTAAQAASTTKAATMTFERTL